MANTNSDSQSQPDNQISNLYNPLLAATWLDTTERWHLDEIRLCAPTYLGMLLLLFKKRVWG